jgi:hypothetical protein
LLILSANYLFNKDRWRSSNGINFETLLHENIHQATVAQMFAVQEMAMQQVMLNHLLE